IVDRRANSRFLRWTGGRPRIQRTGAPGDLSRDRRAPRHAPLRARQQGLRRGPRPSTAGRPRRSQRRPHAAVAIHPDHRPRLAHAHSRAGRRGTRADRARSGPAGPGISRPQGRRHPGLRGVARRRIERRPGQFRVRPSHHAANGPGIGVVRDPKPVAGSAIRGPRHGLGIPVRSAEAGGTAVDARGRRTGGHLVPRPGARLPRPAVAGIGRLGTGTSVGRIRVGELLGSNTAPRYLIQLPTGGYDAGVQPPPPGPPPQWGPAPDGPQDQGQQPQPYEAPQQWGGYAPPASPPTFQQTVGGITLAVIGLLGLLGAILTLTLWINLNS